MSHSSVPDLEDIIAGGDASVLLTDRRSQLSYLDLRAGCTGSDISSVRYVPLNEFSHDEEPSRSRLVAFDVFIIS